MPEYVRVELGQKLIDAGLITPEQYELGMQKHAETQVILRKILVQEGFITEEVLMEFMSTTIGIPFIKDIYGQIRDANIIKSIPEKICRKYEVMPLLKQGDTLMVSMVDPLDVFAIDNLESIAKCKYLY